MRNSLFVYVLVAIVYGFGEAVVLVGSVVLGIQIVQLLLDLVDLSFILLLLRTGLLELLLQLLEFRAIQ